MDLVCIVAFCVGKLQCLLLFLDKYKRGSAVQDFLASPNDKTMKKNNIFLGFGFYTKTTFFLF